MWRSDRSLTGGATLPVALNQLLHPADQLLPHIVKQQVEDGLAAAPVRRDRRKTARPASGLRTLLLTLVVPDGNRKVRRRNLTRALSEWIFLEVEQRHLTSLCCRRPNIPPSDPPLRSLSVSPDRSHCSFHFAQPVLLRPAPTAPPSCPARSTFSPAQRHIDLRDFCNQTQTYISRLQGNQPALGCALLTLSCHYPCLGPLRSLPCRSIG